MQTSRYLKKQIAAVLIIFMGLFGQAGWSVTSDDLPEMGSAADSVLSPAQQERLGKAFMRWVRASQPVIDDPLLEEYIKDLGDALVKHSDGLGSHFKFFLVEDPVVNAYAGPDGHIGVYTGLLLTTESESELASVVAHEITHVTQNHLMRAWHDNTNLSMLQSAALVAAIILGATAGGDAAIAASVGAQAALAQAQINFTRANEKEADRIGISMLYDAGYDPRAMPTFFSRMGRATKTYGTKPPEFLLTHPVTNARISDSLGRAEKYPYRQYTDSFRYLLTRSAIRERQMEDAKKAIAHFEKTLKEGRYRNEDADRYGLALALLRDNQNEAAAREITELREKHPDTLEFIITDARIKLAQKDFAQATNTLEQAIRNFPLSYPLHITLSEIYLRSGQAEKAHTSLKTLAKFRQENTRVYKLLARAAADLGKEAESHEHMATYYYLMGALESSKLQLEIALRTSDLSYFDLARLESKLKKVEKEIAEIKAEEKKG